MGTAKDWLETAGEILVGVARAYNEAQENKSLKEKAGDSIIISGSAQEVAKQIAEIVEENDTSAGLRYTVTVEKDGDTASLIAKLDSSLKRAIQGLGRKIDGEISIEY